MAAVTYVDKGAQISACGTYRYRLWREWRNYPNPAQWDMWTEDDGKPIVDGAGEQLGEPKRCVFIMLNPSTADGDHDDPTIRRCVGFARRWGFDRLEVLNLFAYRATDPRALLALDHNADPVGARNQAAFEKVLYPRRLIGHVICAWGANGSHLGQDETALGWMEDHERFALGLTRDGHPKHPLYLPKDAALTPFRPALRPIHGEEAARECDHAAMMAEENGLRKAKSRTGKDKAKAQKRGAEQLASVIRSTLCQQKGASDV